MVRDRVLGSALCPYKMHIALTLTSEFEFKQRSCHELADEGGDELPAAGMKNRKLRADATITPHS
jgi:hypothetical protein